MKKYNELEIYDNGGVSLEEFSQLEAKLKFRFADDYKKFLLECNGGIPDKSLFDYFPPSSESKLDYVVESFLSCSEILISYDNLSDYEEFIKNNLIPIATTPGAPVICIAGSVSSFGEVYIMSWDFGLTKQADSFTSFIKQLRE